MSLHFVVLFTQTIRKYYQSHKNERCETDVENIFIYYIENKSEYILFSFRMKHELMETNFTNAPDSRLTPKHVTDIGKRKTSLESDSIYVCFMRKQ